MVGHQALHMRHIRKMAEIQFNHIRILFLPVPAGNERQAEGGGQEQQGES